MSKVTKTRTSYDRETGEYIVKAYGPDGKRMPAADYYTTDKEDAKQTAAKMVAEPAGPAFEMYDVLQIDWREGRGWQDYVVLKTQTDWDHAKRIVGGEYCPSMPHWIARTAVDFRIVSDRGVVKVSQ